MFFMSSENNYAGVPCCCQDCGLGQDRCGAARMYRTPLFSGSLPGIPLPPHASRQGPSKITVAAYDFLFLLYIAAFPTRLLAADDDGLDRILLRLSLSAILFRTQ